MNSINDKTPVGPSEPFSPQLKGKEKVPLPAAPVSPLSSSAPPLEASRVSSSPITPEVQEIRSLQQQNLPIQEGRSWWDVITSPFTSKKSTGIDASIHPQFNPEEYYVLIKRVTQPKDKPIQSPSEEMQKLLEIAYKNRQFNHHFQYHKRHNTELYQKNKQVINALLHYSYLTTRANEYMALVEKRDALLAKMKAGETIRKEDKITPSEAHLIDSLSRAQLIPFLESQAKSRFCPEPLKSEWSKISANRTSWQDWGTNHMLVNFQRGDLLIDSSLVNQYHEHRDINHQAMDIFTPGAMYHASIYYTDENAEGLVPSVSHVVTEARSDALEIGTVPTKLHLRIDPFKLLTEQGRDACKAVGIGEDDLRRLYQLHAYQFNRDFHRELVAHPENCQIKNGTISQFKAWAGFGVLSPQSQKLTQIPNEEMACSQFAAYAAMVILNQVEQSVLKRLENEYPEYPLMLNVFHPLLRGDSSLTPAGLYFSLMENKAVERIRNPEIEAVFQTPGEQEYLGIHKDVIRHLF